MWNPGFEHIERQKAVLHGLHRSLCIYSWVHRGTQENPGLVLGLDHGGSCHGMAMRAPGNKRSEVIDYLRARELVTSVYLECWRKISLANGKSVEALVYRVDQTSPQYAKDLSLDHQANIIKSARGGSGHNTEYVVSTVEAMRREGIRDRQLEYIKAQICSDILES